MNETQHAILQPWEMSEEDVKTQFITPAICKGGWHLDYITMEQRVKLTDGKVTLSGNIVGREKPMYADYVLYYNRQTPLAIVEAKAYNKELGHGIQQAMAYGKKMNVPFVYSSNGQGFLEHDFLTGKERVLGLNEFPSKDELYARFKRGGDEVPGITEDEERLMSVPFHSAQGVYPPRYYQVAAVNAALRAIGRGDKRLSLVMATGTGKTLTAFQLIYRLLKSGLKRKVLYLADRNILVDQSIQQDFKPLENVTHKVVAHKEDPKKLSAYNVFFSLYQQLIGQNGEKNYEKLFDKDFFDVVIIDECHRGSARDDSNWREILEYFEGAIHIGMTATPKETKYASNLEYFGKPVYTYSLNDGIEDGFLAPFEVIYLKLNISDGWRPRKGQLDVNGNEIEDRIYNNTDYDYNIVLLDRVREVAAEITKYLKTDNRRMHKTIVFCANEAHAELMRQELCNANADMVKDHPDYVVRITGSDDYGKNKLDYFISVSEPFPVIATTSKLLSTGVDCKMVKLIVLDEWISSMTEFKQIVGRGTRLRWEDDKKYFKIMDCRNVTRLFADDDWDGPQNPDPNYPPKQKPEPEGTEGPEPTVAGTPAGPPKVKPVVDRSGCKVFVESKTVSTYDASGKLLTVESITDYTKRNLQGKYATIDRWRTAWNTAERKNEIIQMMAEEWNIDIMKLKTEQGMDDCDVFDFICHLAYNQKPLTRRERANNVKKRNVFAKYGEQAREVLNALLEKYMDNGIMELDSMQVLHNAPFNQKGIRTIMGYFNGRDGYIQAVNELKSELYNIA